MAPDQYASEGISLSRPIYLISFSVLVLDILSGKRNSCSHQCDDFISLIVEYLSLYI
jgi:hypothetical protein